MTLGGKWEVRVGEAKWGYQMLIPGYWQDFRMSWYPITTLADCKSSNLVYQLQCKKIMCFTMENGSDALKTCKWAPLFHLHGHELWPTDTHPHPIPSAPFSGMLVHPYHSQTPRYHSQLYLLPIWNGISTCTSILTVSRYQHPITSLGFPHPYFPFFP